MHGPRRDRAAPAGATARPVHLSRADCAAGSHSGGHARARSARRQTRTGVVAGFAEHAPATGDLRAILDLVDTAPFLPADLLELCRWTARYYLASLADVIGTIVPARVPDAAEASAVRLVRRLDAGEVATLERRARARAAAYRALAAAPDGAMLLRDARAAASAQTPCGRS
jgi:primosomal protein N' (replication factor Y)